MHQETSKQSPQQHHHAHTSLQVLIPEAPMKHHQSSESAQPSKASSSQAPGSTKTTSGLLAKALSRVRDSSNTPQAAPNVSASASSQPTATATPIQPQAPHDPSRPTRAARVPAVTSKSMTTAPVKDKSRPPRRKYPSNMGQRP